LALPVAEYHDPTVKRSSVECRVRPSRFRRVGPRLGRAALAAVLRIAQGETAPVELGAHAAVDNGPRGHDHRQGHNRDEGRTTTAPRPGELSPAVRTGLFQGSLTQRCPTTRARCLTKRHAMILCAEVFMGDTG